MTSVNGGPSVSQQANTQAVMESPNTSTFGLANPTASTGLTAVNGSANTAMRSDGAPALDVAISPTWTGTHTYSVTTNGTYSLSIDNNSNGTANRARVVLDSGDTQARLTAAGSGSTAAVVSGGAVGASLNLIAVQDIPLVLAQNNTARASFNTGGGLQIITTVGFNNTTPIAKPAVTGSRDGNAALASLLTALANYGLITDSTSA